MPKWTANRDAQIPLFSVLMAIPGLKVTADGEY